MTGCANWRDEAACRDADSDLFFPVGTTGPALRQIDAAKRICRDCPVQTRCLAWALENGIADGVWGGTTPDERRVIRSPLQKSQLPGKTTRAMFNDGHTQPSFDRLSCGFARLASIGSATSFGVRGVRHEMAYFTSFTRPVHWVRL